MKQLSRIVIRGTNWIGDAVMTIPALREIRRIFPNAWLSLLVKPWVADLFSGAGYADEVISPAGWVRDGLKEFLSVRRALIAGTFDAAILLPNAASSALLAWSARIPRRAGFATGGRSLLLTDSIPLTKETKCGFQLFSYLRLVSEIEKRWVGADTVRFDNPRYELDLGARERAQGRELLAAHGLHPGQPVVAMVPGSTNSRAKRWLPSRFAETGDALREKFGAQIILMGAAGDRETGEQVTAQSRDQIRNLIGRTSLRETIAILANCDLVISNDTGPAHIAAALRRPVLTIFGPTNFNSIRPYSDTAETMHQPVECSPCMLRDCPIDHRCMARITSEMVIESAARMLESRAGASVSSGLG